MLEWKDVISLVVSTLGNDVESSVCLLEFLRVLPEEVTEGRKVALTVCPRRFAQYLWTELYTNKMIKEDELTTRSQELLTENATQVLTLLVQYAQSTGGSRPSNILSDLLT